MFITPNSERLTPNCRLILRALLLGAALLCATRLRAQESYIQSGDVRVHHWPGQRNMAASIVRTGLQRPFRGLPADILARGTIIDLFLAPDEARFDSLTGGRAPEWGAGVAMPQQNLIVVPGYVSKRSGAHEVGVTTRHELAHVALQRYLGPTRIPRWFTEGYATWAAGQFDDGGWILRFAFATDRAPPLDSLTLDWPDLEGDARMAYLLSASAVRYLYALGNAATFQRFLQSWQENGSFEAALRTEYLVTSAQFERLWRAHVKRRYGWVQIIAQSAFMWLVLSLLVVLLFIVRRRRDRARLQRLRATELPDAPAFWLEPLPEDLSAQEPRDDVSGPVSDADEGPSRA